MSPKSDDLLSPHWVPEGDRSIETSTGQAFAVGAIGNSADPGRAALECADLLARGGLMDADRPVSHGGGQVGPLRTEGHVHGSVAAVPGSEDGFPGTPLPELKDAVLAEFASCTGQPVPILAEGHTVDAARH